MESKLLMGIFPFGLISKYWKYIALRFVILYLVPLIYFKMAKMISFVCVLLQLIKKKKKAEVVAHTCNPSTIRG